MKENYEHMKRNEKKRFISVVGTLAVAVSLLVNGMGISVSATEISETEQKPKAPAVSSDGVTTWDCIYFGEYWQDDTNGDGKADEKDEKQPIKWRVLSVNGEDAFLVSDVALDCKQYNVEWSDQGLSDYITWETCTLRSWLNGYGSDSNKCKRDYSNSNFIDNAFSSVEQSYIKTASVENNNHPEWGTEGGNDTQDKIFLLSIEETYMSDYGLHEDVDRYTKCSDYASQNGAYRHTSDDIEYVDNCYWWLRSPGYYSNDAATINVFGFKDTLGCSVDESDVAIRPVLHLDLSDGNVWKYAGTVSSYNVAEHEHTGGTATCTQKAVCVICGKEYGELSAHKENKGIITKEATKDSKGIITYSCGVCGKVLRTEEYSVNVSNDTGTTEQNNTANQAVVPVVPTKEQDTVVKGTIVTVKMLKYQVTIKEDNKHEVAYVGTENKKAKKITIPASIVINGVTYKVSSIANGAFKNNKKLTTVVIGKNVTTIGKGTFKGCSKLKTITINSNVLKKVGKNAFKGINKKASIKVPKKKKKAYQKLLKRKGQSKSVKIK